MNSVAIKLRCERDRLVPDFHNSSHSAAKRHGPSVAIGSFPVRRQSWLPSNVPALLQVVIDEILEQELIHIRAAARARHRPDIVRQNSQSPMPRLG